MPASNSNNNALYSTMVRAGRTTFFIDIKEAKNGNKFLSIAESKLTKENKKERVTVRVFGDTIREFSKAVEEAAGAAG